MLVVLDTTETYTHFWRDFPRFTLLLGFARRRPARVSVPEIVFEETVNHHSERLAEALRVARGKAGDVNELAPGAIDGTVFDIDVPAANRRYVETLEAWLAILNAERPSYTDVAIRPLVARALARRKPFDAEGHKGFRDAVLWETILKMLAESSDEVILVTRNKKDFGEHGQLAGDLRNDLRNHGLREDCVKVCEGLSRFVEEYVKPTLEKLDEIRRKIEDEGRFLAFDPGQCFTERHEEIVAALDRRIRACAFNAEVGTGEVLTLRKPELGELSRQPEGVTVCDVRRLGDDDRIAAWIDYRAKGRIRCEHDQGYCWPGANYVPGEGEATFWIPLTILLKENTGEIINWETNEAHISFSFDPLHFLTETR